MIRRHPLSALVSAALLAGLIAACNKTADTPAATPPTVHKHEHHPPHGGTPVVLGEEAYHLELVRDAAAGKLQAYVLDGEMENFIRSADPSLQIVAFVNGKKEPLELKAVADLATGEKVGDTSLFEGQADWLKTTGEFDATLIGITIRGTKFDNVPFNFPKGNDKD